MSLCDMCLKPMEFSINLLIKQKLIIADLESQLTRALEDDSCTKLLKQKITNNITLLEKKLNKLPGFNPEESYQMVTITFDPKKFPVLRSRTAQRDYIIQSLEELIISPGRILPDFYGCFELHDSGIVHAHLMIQNIDIQELEILKKKFTNNSHNITAIHCCSKTFEDVLVYINKKETKDKNNHYNFYLFRKETKVDLDITKIKSYKNIQNENLIKNNKLKKCIEILFPNLD